jgi:hypothetical protein
MIQYSRELSINRDVTAYWIPAFAGMTIESGARSSAKAALPSLQMQIHILAALIASELCQKTVPRKNRGRRENRVPNAPAASRAEMKKARA